MKTRKSCLTSNHDGLKQFMIAFMQYGFTRLKTTFEICH